MRQVLASAVASTSWHDALVRIALSGDMEAIAGITDVRETFGWCREYWEAGREAYTRDVVAAVQGLLDAGADEVVVLDNHGAGAPWNILLDRLPAGARGESVNVFDLPRRGVDGLLLVGYHPPAGIDGFVPHTYVPGVRLSVDGVEIGEAHGRAWAADVPLLGITGHEALRPTLGPLAEAPFLTVQTGPDRLGATPVFGDATESTEAIRAFASDCLRGISAAPHPRPPADFTFEARVVGAEAVTLSLARWSDAREPIAAAMGAGMAPFMQLVSRFDMSSKEAFAEQDSETQDRLTELLLDALVRLD
jgi:D-aminopeptidase